MMPLTGSSWQNPKLTGALLLSLVFLSGGVTGALVANSTAHRGMHKAAFWTPTGRSLSVQNFKTELDLTPSQCEEMESILDDFAKYYRTVLGSAKTRILKVLNSDQQRKFEQMLEQQRR